MKAKNYQLPHKNFKQFASLQIVIFVNPEMTKIFRISCLFLISVLFTFANAIAQNKEDTYFISGTVQDQNGLPLATAHIKDISSGITTMSDKDGNFIIKALVLPTKLEATFIGYKSQTLVAKGDDIDKNTNTIFLNFILELDIVEIPDVVVTAEKKAEKIFDPPQAYLFDYTFFDGNLLLLVSEKGNRKLQLLTSSGQTVSEQPISQSVYEFTYTCQNNLYLLGKDSAYQVLEKETDFTLANSSSRQTYELRFDDCETCTDVTCLKKTFEDHAQTQIIYSADKKSLDKIGIKYKITNKATRAFNEGAYNNILAQAGVDPMFASTANLNSINQSRELECEIWFYQKILSKPIYCPLKSINDSLYLFDHVNDEIIVLDNNGDIITERSLLYDDKRKPRLQEILVNEEKSMAYAYYIVNGIGTLKPINLVSGEVEGSITLNEHRFPEHVKASGNYIYYLYKELGYDDKYRLYRQPIN